jgi:polyhydroxybutyrate depolymerase
MTGRGRARLVVAAAAVVALFALVAGSVTAASPASPASSTAVPRHPTAPSSAPGTTGCGRAPRPGPTTRIGGTADVVQALAVGGQTRTYRLAIPGGYRSRTPSPLILLFHGSGSNALQQSAYSGMPARGARAGFVVATPDAVAEQWQLSAPDAHSADLAFVSSLITSLSARYCIDRSRVYAAGISLGSEFSAIVACAVPHRIAAIGLVAAEFVPQPCAGPIPVMAFHGTADPLVPYANGGVGESIPGVHLPGAEQNLAAWARLDGCQPKPVRRHVAPAVVERRWPGCRRGGAALLYSVEGGGHTWPGSPVVLPSSVFGPTTDQVDATGLMLAFFAHHPGRG